MVLAESPTFHRGGGMVEVTVFKLVDDPDHDDDVPLRDLAVECD